MTASKTFWPASRRSGSAPVVVRWMFLLAVGMTCFSQAAELKDFFADREVLTSTNGVVNGNNVGATREPDEPEHGDKAGGRSVWISWIAPTNGIASFRTTGSTFDTLLAAYYFKPGNPQVLGELEEEVSDDDDPDNAPASFIQFAAQAGRRYEIAVDGYLGATGSVALAWEFVPIAVVPVVLGVPVDQAVRLGDTVTLSVDVQTTPEMKLQWRFNGKSLDVEGPTLVIQNLQATNVGRYSLRIRIDVGDEEVRFETPAIELQINSDGRTNALARDKIVDSLSSPLEPEDDDSPDARTAVKSAADMFLAVGGGLAAGYNGSQIFNTTYATPDPNEPPHCGVAGGASYWYTYRAPTNGTLFLDTIGSAFNTVLAVYQAPTGTFTYQDLVQLGCDNDGVAPFGASRVQIPVEAGQRLFVVVDGVNGARGIARLNYRLVPPAIDSTRPKLQVKAPLTVRAVTTTNHQYLLQGTASDDVGLSNVLVQTDSGAILVATGTTNWLLLVELHPGTNTFRIQAGDLAGNTSTEVVRRVVFAVMSPLNLTRVGIGTIQGARNGQLLEVGRSYSLTARPAPGQKFRGWSGDMTAASATLPFTMQSNLTLIATFVPNPFSAMAGSYRGVFCDTNPMTLDSAGLVSLSLRSSGAFSGTVRQAGGLHRFNGNFDLDGVASVEVSRQGTNALGLALKLDHASGSVTGRVSGAGWVTDFLASRAIFRVPSNPATNFMGRYTLSIPGGTNAVAVPAGDGYATVTVRSSGQGTMSVILADGTRFTQVVPLSATGEASLFQPLYQSRGFLLGRFHFRPSAEVDLDGAVHWLCSPGVSPVAYTNGFVLSSPSTGSVFQSDGRPLNLDTARLLVSLGDGQPLATNLMSVSASGLITNLGPQPMTLVVDSRTGVLKGGIQLPGDVTSTSFSGVTLQRQGSAAGFLQRSNLVGRIHVSP